MPPELPDIQLLRNRDRDSWDALYRSTCQRSYRVLRHVTGASPSVLEELNQDVWLSAIDSILQFDATRGTPQDWILGIARFKGLTYVRRRYRCRVVSVGCSVADQIAAVDVPTDADGRIALLRASIESLPEQWQYVLRQKYEAGLSVKEISELAGVTPKAVESTLSRARQRLRDLYRDTVESEVNS